MKPLNPEHAKKLDFIYSYSDIWSESFQLFPTDFTGNEQVKMMSPEQVGTYFLLICSCFQLKLALPNCPDKMARIVGLSRARFDEISPDVLACFAKHPTKPGYLTHLKLIKIRYAQLQQQLSRYGKLASDNEKTTKPQRNDNEKTTDNQRNVTPQSSVLSPRSSSPQTSILNLVRKPSDDGMALAQKLYESIQLNKPELAVAKLTGKALETKLLRMAAVIDIGLRNDGYSVQQWHQLLDWIKIDNKSRNGFCGWGNVVLSAEKLRQQNLWAQFFDRTEKRRGLGAYDPALHKD